MINFLLVNRWPQFVIRVLALAGFLLVILGGLLGTPVGNQNISIVLLWIGWWGVLILMAVPALGRGWCSICPIPLVGEWLQRGAVLGPVEGRRGIGLNRPWPKRLRNIWVQNGFFLGLAVFSTLILTNPLITSIAVLALLLISTGISLVFERRAFCRYVCPVSGFIGLYSQVAPIEVRVVDPNICRDHSEKTCYTGNGSGYGCPWGLFPAAITKNVNCGTCMECLRACPYQNMGVNTRPIGKDLLNPRERRMDEAFKAFIMMGGAVVYSLVLLGPWGSIKQAAYLPGSLGWLVFASALVLFVLVILPGTLYMGIRLSVPGLTSAQMKREFIQQSYALVPLGLAAWIAFSLSFIFTNISYVYLGLSDPFGWGWNLLGMTGGEWSPLFTAITPSLQVAVLLVGLGYATFTSIKVSGETQHHNTSIPLIGLALAVTIGQLWILVG